MTLVRSAGTTQWSFSVFPTTNDSQSWDFVTVALVRSAGTTQWSFSVFLTTKDSWDLAAVALVRFTRNHRRRSEISGCDDERGSGVLCFSTFAHSATTQVSLGRLGFNLIPPLSLSSRYLPPLLTPSSPAVSSAPSVLNSEISRHKVNASFISYKIAQRWVAQPDCASNVFHVTPDNRDFLKVCDIILFVSSPNRRFRPDDGMH